MNQHDQLRATWKPGQQWETRIEECAGDPAAWVPVADGGRAQPVWDERQEYRQRPDDGAKQVPLTEQLRSVPADAVLRIDTPNALGCMDTRSIPVGPLCHQAADVIGLAEASLAALEAALHRAVWLYENYGLLAQPIEGDPLAAGRWIGEARAALKGLKAPAAGAPEVPRG